jgi:hypothetical protein
VDTGPLRSFTTEDASCAGTRRKNAISAVVTAAHQAVDALARMAMTDIEAVTAAEDAGRLYVPTRSLSDHYDVPPVRSRACRAVPGAPGCLPGRAGLKHCSSASARRAGPRMWTIT